MNPIVTAQQRLSVYHHALDSLIAENNYYRCICSLLQMALGELYGYKYVLLQRA
jgi:glutamyl/glutaminyl-tRNA synthetase